MTKLTQSTLKDLLDYDPETGDFTWLKRGQGRSVGSIAGHQWVDRSGIKYINICVQRQRCRAHRLAWLWVYGVWPDKYVDHIDGDGSNNRISNLRLATASENLANSKRPKNNTSGAKGVSFDQASQKYVAKISVNCKRLHLGSFDTVSEAAEAYAKAAKGYYGEFARLA